MTSRRKSRCLSCCHHVRLSRGNLQSIRRFPFRLAPFATWNMESQSNLKSLDVRDDETPQSNPRPRLLGWKRFASVVSSRLRGWLSGHLPLGSSSVCWFEGVADGRPKDAQRRGWRCLVIPGSHNVRDGAAVLRMVAQQRGWPHRAGGDGGDAPHWSDVTASSRAGAG
jgi:hypothetical protein